MKKFYIWLCARFNEKSTRTAFIGLLGVSLSHTNFIPPDVLREVTGFLTALLVTSAFTDG